MTRDVVPSYIYFSYITFDMVLSYIFVYIYIYERKLVYFTLGNMGIIGIKKSTLEGNWYMHIACPKRHDLREGVIFASTL